MTAFEQERDGPVVLRVRWERQHRQRMHRAGFSGAEFQNERSNNGARRSDLVRWDSYNDRCESMALA